ncbi:MAG: rubredoxin [Clostridia bacterium]|nr:rubredoxin [Clostridia bacterium]
MKKFVCQLCGYVYDERIGDLENGIESETEFDEIPKDWVCPLCGASKDDFEEIDEEDDSNI